MKLVDYNDEYRTLKNVRPLAEPYLSSLTCLNRTATNLPNGESEAPVRRSVFRLPSSSGPRVSILSNPRSSSALVGEKSDRLLLERLR